MNPVEPTDAEYEEATGLWRDDFRIRDLARLLAQIRVANERAEAAEKELGDSGSLEEWKQVVADCHGTLDTAGVAPCPEGTDCRRADCNSKLQHRLHTLLEARLAALPEPKE